LATGCSQLFSVGEDRWCIATLTGVGLSGQALSTAIVMTQDLREACTLANAKLRQDRDGSQ